MNTKRDIALDIMRGLAIILMVEIHALIHIRPQEDLAYDLLRSLGTLAAPFFLLCAGMGMDYLRRGRANDPARLRQTLWRRGVFLILFASSLGLIYLDIGRVFDWDIFTLIGAVYVIGAIMLRWNWLHLMVGLLLVMVLNWYLPIRGPILLRSGSFPIIPFAAYFLLGGLLVTAKISLTRTQLRVLVIVTAISFLFLVMFIGANVLRLTRFDAWSNGGILAISSLFACLYLLWHLSSATTFKFTAPIITLGNLSFSLYYVQYFFLLILPKGLELVLGREILIEISWWGWLISLVAFVSFLYLVVIIWQRFDYKLSLEWIMHKYISPRSSFERTTNSA